MMGLEIVPDHLDVVEFGGIFWQPLDGEPMLARFERLEGKLADVDRAVCPRPARPASWLVPPAGRRDRRVAPGER